MDEAKRIAYYDAHRDEPQKLEDVVPTPADRKRETLTVTIAVRFPASEAENISQMARATGKTFSDIVRAAVQRYVQPEIVLQPNEENVLPSIESQSQRIIPGSAAPNSAKNVQPYGARTQSATVQPSTD